MCSCHLAELRCFSETDTIFAFMQSPAESVNNEPKLFDEFFAVLHLIVVAISLRQRDEEVHSISHR